MTRRGHLSDELLSSYVDNALTENELRDVRAHVADCEACRRRVERVAALRERIAALPRERGASPELRAAIEASLSERARSVNRRWIGAGAAALVLAAAAVAVWLARPAPPLSATLRDELALDHRHYMGAQAAQFASNDSQVLEAQLARALDRPVSVPDWEAATLVGGRACRINRHLVALILYERAGHRVSLFELPQENARDGCDQAEGFNVCARRQPSGGALAIVSDLPQSDLKRLLALSDETSRDAPKTQ